MIKTFNEICDFVYKANYYIGELYRKKSFWFYKYGFCNGLNTVWTDSVKSLLQTNKEIVKKSQFFTMIVVLCLNSFSIYMKPV